MQSYTLFSKERHSIFLKIPKRKIPEKIPDYYWRLTSSSSDATRHSSSKLGSALAAPSVPDYRNSPLADNKMTL